MQTDINQKIGELEKKLDATYQSIEKVRKYMMWTAIITIAVIVLPLIGLMFLIPSFISNYMDVFNTLEL